LSEGLTIHIVRLVRYMGKGTDGPQEMREEIQAENEGVTFPTPVRWISNSCTNLETEQTCEINASSVEFVVKWKKVELRPVSKAMSAAGVQYKVKTDRHAETDSHCECCCRWGQIESKCIH